MLNFMPIPMPIYSSAGTSQAGDVYIVALFLYVIFSFFFAALAFIEADRHHGRKSLFVLVLWPILAIRFFIRNF